MGGQDILGRSGTDLELPKKKGKELSKNRCWKKGVG